jgi:rubredoxin
VDSSRRDEALPACAVVDDDGGIDAGTRMECKVCWYVYDPAEGDVVWQVPAGTSFSRLPPHWTCPNCSTMKDQFLVLPDE